MVPLSCIIELSCLYLYSMLIVLFSKFSARVIFDDLWSKYENEPALFFGHEKTKKILLCKDRTHTVNDEEEKGRVRKGRKEG